MSSPPWRRCACELSEQYRGEFGTGKVLGRGVCLLFARRGGVTSFCIVPTSYLLHAFCIIELCLSSWSRVSSSGDVRSLRQSCCALMDGFCHDWQSACWYHTVPRRVKTQRLYSERRNKLNIVCCDAGQESNSTLFDGKRYMWGAYDGLVSFLFFFLLCMGLMMMGHVFFIFSSYVA